MGRPPQIAEYHTQLDDITGEYADRFRALDPAMDEHHPVKKAHAYLAFMAVHPEWQGHGLGRALLADRHAILDTTGTPAYLVATGTRNRTLFLRNGYRIRTPYHLPAGGPYLFPMVRPPAESEGRSRVRTASSSPSAARQQGNS
jgi:GNAT superfamily N-acetyltransferase